MGAYELTDRQARGLVRLGDVVIPGDEALPSFSESGAAAGIDRMLPYMHEGDRESLLMLLAACATLPRPAIRAVVAMAARGDRAPGPLAGVLRMANIGIKGVVCSLYYSDIETGPEAGRIHRAIGWDPVMVERNNPRGSEA
jgi:hypothetical protein